MELSKKDRLSLYNQYEILKLLNKNEPHMVETYETNQEILLNGYKYNYRDLVEWVLDDTPDDVSKFVWEVFNMYRTLHNSYHLLSPVHKEQIDLEDITYQGYDGNEECDYYTYANFILKQMKRYDEIYNGGKAELNSHRNMVPTYQRMLDAWNRVRRERYAELSLNQILEIIS